MQHERKYGIFGGSVLLLFIILSGVVFHLNETAGGLMFGWPMAATLQGVAHLRDGGSPAILAPLVLLWGLVLFCLYAYALTPRKSTLVFSIVTNAISLVIGIALAVLFWMGQIVFFL